MKLHEIPPALLCFARSKREWVHSALAFYLSDGLLLVVVVESEFLPLQLAEFTQHNANNVRKGHT
jgi:hypothetical protein